MPELRISQRHFLITLATVTLIKLFFSFGFPVYYDEWYYVLWGKHLSPVYFDHPPMVGWVLYLMSLLGDHIAWYRMLPIGATLLATWVIYRLAREITDAESGRFAALLFILSPSYILMFLVSSDGPLLLLIVIGVMSFFVAAHKDNWRWAVLSGVAFGLGILTKYLVVFPAVGVLVFALWRNRPQRLRLLLITLLSSLPFVAHHLYYNYLNCWETLNFHLYIREGGYPWLASFSFYIFEALLVLTPWGLWYLWRHRSLVNTELSRYLAIITVVCLLLFALSSYKSVIGLHFFLIFVPFLFALYGLIDTDKSRRWMLRMSYGYAAVWILIFTTLLVFPWDKVKGWKHSSDFVIALKPQGICTALDKYKDQPLFTSFYAPAAILGYECKRDIGVLFGTSSFGREYDKWTDLTKLEGKSLVMVDIGEIATDARAPYFSSSRREIIQVEGAPFTIFIGEGFNYALYKKNVLTQLRDAFYTPRRKIAVGGCPFTQKYFGETDTQMSPQSP